jgi:hypothetical protein
MAPHGHYQFFESFFDSDVIRVEVFGFQNLLVYTLCTNAKN